MDGMGGFFDSLGQGALDQLYKFRYGVSEADKDQMMYSGNFPGAISYMKDPEGAERATSGYLAGQNWGPLGVPMTDLFNVIRQNTIARDERPELRDMAVNAASQGAFPQEMGGFNFPWQ